jgi:uncharacterized membrane protein HdeD (DUF308 family)
MAEGVVSILYATEHRKRFSAGWGWMLASGLLDLVLAVILLTLISMALQARLPAQ